MASGGRRQSHAPRSRRWNKLWPVFARNPCHPLWTHQPTASPKPIKNPPRFCLCACGLLVSMLMTAAYVLRMQCCAQCAWLTVWSWLKGENALPYLENLRSPISKRYFTKPRVLPVRLIKKSSFIGTDEAAAIIAAVVFHANTPSRLLTGVTRLGRWLGCSFLFLFPSLIPQHRGRCQDVANAMAKESLGLSLG